MFFIAGSASKTLVFELKYMWLYRKHMFLIHFQPLLRNRRGKGFLFLKKYQKLVKISFYFLNLFVIHFVLEVDAYADRICTGKHRRTET